MNMHGGRGAEGFAASPLQLPRPRRSLFKLYSTAAFVAAFVRRCCYDVSVAPVVYVVSSL